MRKFKCVKNYPGADLGTIVQYQLGTFPEYFDIKDAKRYNKRDIENYPEFWEEIIEKDYEILMYRGKINTDIYFDNPEYFNRLNSDWEIYHIKRLSDGIEFKIGDKVYNPKSRSQTFIIESFYLDCNNIHLLCGKGHINITKIEHYKEPILITEDRVELYQYDNFYFVDTMFNLGRGVLGANIHNPIKGYKHFSTKEAANKYIYENKPEFSRKQILEALDYAKYAEFSQGKWIIASKIKEKLKL